MRQAPLGEAISSPNALLDGYPEEELAAQRSPALPDSLLGWKSDGADKAGSISCFAAIGT